MIDVSPNALRKEVTGVLRIVQDEMRKYEDEAQLIGPNASPFQIEDKNGNANYAILIATKSECLATLTELNNQVRRR